MERRSDCLLMIAARAPHAGATKTRLGQAIGMERAAGLYAAFLRDLADRLTPDPTIEPPAYDLAWTHSPPDVDFRDELLRATGDVPDHVHYVPQIDDEDWGARQSALLKWGWSHGYARTILIASDSPQLERDILLAAFDALVANDVVIGRVLDGGYYLIGQRGFREVVQGVEMSTASAAGGVIDHARMLGLLVAEVPETFDVDVEDDLDRLREHLTENEGGSAPATWQALGDLGLLDQQGSGSPGSCTRGRSSSPKPPRVQDPGLQ